VPADVAEQLHALARQGAGQRIPALECQIALAKKVDPQGNPSLDDFELTEAPAPEPGAGEVLMRVLYLSLARTCADA
jgi:hypothetical protein